MYTNTIASKLKHATSLGTIKSLLTFLTLFYVSFYERNIYIYNFLQDGSMQFRQPERYLQGVPKSLNDQPF